MSVESLQRREVSTDARPALRMVKDGADMAATVDIGEDVTPSAGTLMQEAIHYRAHVGRHILAAGGRAPGLSFGESLRRVASNLTTDQLQIATLSIRDQIPDKELDRLERRVRMDVPTGKIVHVISFTEGHRTDDFNRISVSRDPEEVESEVVRNLSLRLIETQARAEYPEQFAVSKHIDCRERPFMVDAGGSLPQKRAHPLR